MALAIIGDVHGKVRDYKNLLKNLEYPNTIQLGDFGFKEQHDWFLNNIDYTKNKILFGNHDYIPYRNLKHSFGDYSYILEFGTDYDIFVIRGAYSIDKVMRIEGKSWFVDEEIQGYQEWQKIINLFEEKQPLIVITHDCPQFFREKYFNIFDKSITSNGLQACFEVWQPLYWFWGHHHKSLNVKEGKTNFICLNELEYYKIN